MNESNRQPSKHYELAAGLVLPGVFGAELVFYFQILTHDLATHFDGQPLSWLVLKYGLGLWFVLYVCTSFMVTVTNTDRAAYDWRGFWMDVAESAVSFIALAFLGFVDIEVTHAYLQKPEIPLTVAFAGIFLIAVGGALHSSARHHRKVTRARWIGGAAGLAMFLLLTIGGLVGPLTREVVVICADLALVACVVALGSYFAGRWAKA